MEYGPVDGRGVRRVGSGMPLQVQGQFRQVRNVIFAANGQKTFD